MARITRVKKAQQRYETVPVLNEDGTVKRTPVIDKRTGEQKVSKRGPVFMTVTVQDKTKPLPPLECDWPGCDITEGKIHPGQSYKHISPKSGPYGGIQRNRHDIHPDWNIWDYSYSVSAQAARVQHDMHNTIDSFEFTAYEDFDSLRDEIAEQADDFVNERDEAVSNMPEGLQDGSQAQEYFEAAESWKDEIDQADAPDSESDKDSRDCTACDGTGNVEEDDEDGHRTEECSNCDGLGTVNEVDTPSEDWIEEAKSVLRDLVDGLEI